MNILFEIADRDLMIIGAILVVILIIGTIIFKVVSQNNKVKPISEDERFDNENDVEEINDEPLEKVELTLEQQKAKDELERVFNQMSADLEKQNQKHDEIDTFEKEQEENAIISYQELMAEAERLKKQADKYEAHIEQNADMKIDDAIDSYKEHTEKTIKPEEKKNEYHGFKNSDIISPIFGIQKEGKVKENSAKRQNNGIISRAYEEIDSNSESEQNLDFLNSLKEFRKNL